MTGACRAPPPSVLGWLSSGGTPSLEGTCKVPTPTLTWGSKPLQGHASWYLLPKPSNHLQGKCTMVLGKAAIPAHHKRGEKRETANRQNKPSQQSTQPFDVNAFMAMLSQPHNQGSLQRASCPLGLGAGESHGICTQPDGVGACVLLWVLNPVLARKEGQTRSGPSCRWCKDWGAGGYGWGIGTWEENGDPRGPGTGWPDLSLSDPIPHPITSVECCTHIQNPAGAGGLRASLPSPMSSATMLFHGEGRELREQGSG